MSGVRHRPPIEKPLSGWTCAIGLSLWLSLCFGLAGVFVERDIRDAQDALTQYGTAYSDHLDKQMVSNETILKGFSALFAAIGRTDPGITSRYVRQVIEANPQIFALEIAQGVERSRLVEFVAGKRRDGIPHFTVKSFSYESDRKWQPVKDKESYYPIVFMEPLRAGAEDVLGLDVDSVPLLQRAMAQSLRLRAPVASHPFRLVQGNLAYVVFCPIARPSGHDVSPPASVTKDELLVDMVIDAARLTDADRFPLFDGGTLVVFHNDFRPDDPKGHLLKIAGQARSPIETAVFPSFVYKKSLATLGEPFSLIVTRQLGWSDLHLSVLALLASLTLISSLVLVAYLRSQQQGRLQQIENRRRLWRLANHDGLTGLPNRMLLMDRMGQMLARMRRHGRRLAVMFLDIDDFKQVNDTYGHEVGDELIKFVAERLRAAVRAEDTVARMCGDEFIVLIEAPEGREELERVRQNIRQRLSDGLPAEGHPIPVRISIGIATFPEDGDSAESLIKRADMRMYEDKAHQRLQ